MPSKSIHQSKFPPGISSCKRSSSKATTSLIFFGWLHKKSTDRTSLFIMMVGTKSLDMAEGLTSFQKKSQCLAKSQETILLKASLMPKIWSRKFITILIMSTTRSNKHILKSKSFRFMVNILEVFGLLIMPSMLRGLWLFKREFTTHRTTNLWLLTSK